MLSRLESAQDRCIGVHTYDFCYGRRPSFVIGRSISIIPSVLADDQCKVRVTQSRQLICLLHQIWLSSDELLCLCFCCVRHTVCFRITRTRQHATHPRKLSLSKTEWGAGSKDKYWHISELPASLLDRLYSILLVPQGSISDAPPRSISSPPSPLHFWFPLPAPLLVPGEIFVDGVHRVPLDTVAYEALWYGLWLERWDSAQVSKCVHFLILYTLWTTSAWLYINGSDIERSISGTWFEVSGSQGIQDDLRRLVRGYLDERLSLLEMNYQPNKWYIRISFCVDRFNQCSGPSLALFSVE